MISGTFRLEKELVRIDFEVEVRTRKLAVPTLTIDLDLASELVEVSIAMRGYEKRLVRKNVRWAETVSGQAPDYVLSHFGGDPGVGEFISLWRRWHFNNLRAGTRAQLRALAEAPEPWKVSYDSAREELRRRDLLVDRGYEYGSLWLVEYPHADVVPKLVGLVEAFGGKWQSIEAA